MTGRRRPVRRRGCRLWVVTFTGQPAYRHTLWALSLATGTTVSQRPVDVSGSRSRPMPGSDGDRHARMIVPAAILCAALGER